ncbi:MAG: hypothetical protein ACSHW7_00460 [Patiriisocius sp.]|uniref:hypothetical protein n=1 Tax=Patiriisocius sp. TaxID=2822396 RepID=UPI003EF71643
MKITKLKDIIISPGESSPKIFATDNELYLFFYYNQDFDEKKFYSEIKERNALIDEGTVMIKFANPLIHKFGSPNSEVLSGHNLYKFGIEFFEAHLIEDSTWLKEISTINSVHRYYKEEKFSKYKHYLLSFDDNTFECISKDYNITYSKMKMFDLILTILQKSIADEF